MASVADGARRFRRADSSFMIVVFYLVCFLFFVVAEQAQNVEEQVYEVEIQRKAADERQLLRAVVYFVTVFDEHLFDFLRVVSRKPNEQQYAHVGDNPIHHAAVEENVHNRSYDEPNEPKELRAFLVTKPMNDMAANIPAVMKNAVAMDVDV